MTDEEQAAIKIAKRIADGKGTDDDVTVLEDYLAERAEARLHDHRYAFHALQWEGWDRLAWWRRVLAEDREAAAFAISLGAESMTGTELTARIRQAYRRCGERRKDLALRFARLNHAEHLVRGPRARRPRA